MTVSIIPEISLIMKHRDNHGWGKLISRAKRRALIHANRRADAAGSRRREEASLVDSDLETTFPKRLRREGRKLLESGGVARGEYLQLRGSKNRDSGIMAPEIGLIARSRSGFLRGTRVKTRKSRRESFREAGGWRGEGLVIFGSV